ncbi:MAG: hypothetical protein LBF86_00850 [Helicobacteraceae bacterium]|jgi:hypothetical protein|nr:hypothetical protein [Helicobacteraceae bacterium]
MDNQVNSEDIEQVNPERGKFSGKNFAIAAGSMIGIYILTSIAADFLGLAEDDMLKFGFAIISASAIALAVFSKSIELKRYKGFFTAGPLLVFFATILVWIIAFPGYLYSILQVRDGNLPLKQGGDQIEKDGVQKNIPAGIGFLIIILVLLGLIARSYVVG